MRQGPDYYQRFEWRFNTPIITVPLELVSDFENSSCVQFHDNGNGTFQLRVFDTLSDVDKPA